jgi:hypothetical protein
MDVWKSINRSEGIYPPAGRYESKHRVSKSLTESAKNFINITHTVSSRQQLRMCSTIYNGMFVYSRNTARAGEWESKKRRRH